MLNQAAWELGPLAAYVVRPTLNRRLRHRHRCPIVLDFLAAIAADDHPPANTS